MELLVCLSIVPATTAPTNTCAGEEVIWPQLAHHGNSGEEKMHLQRVRRRRGGSQYPLAACKSLVCNRKEQALPETYASLSCRLKLMIRPTGPAK